MWYEKSNLDIQNSWASVSSISTLTCFTLQYCESHVCNLSWCTIFQYPIVSAAGFSETYFKYSNFRYVQIYWTEIRNISASLTPWQLNIAGLANALHLVQSENNVKTTIYGSPWPARAASRVRAPSECIVLALQFLLNCLPSISKAKPSVPKRTSFAAHKTWERPNKCFLAKKNSGMWYDIAWQRAHVKSSRVWATLLYEFYKSRVLLPLYLCRIWIIVRTYGPLPVILPPIRTRPSKCQEFLLCHVLPPSHFYCASSFPTHALLVSYQAALSLRCIYTRTHARLFCVCLSLSERIVWDFSLPSRVSPSCP